MNRDRILLLLLLIFVLVFISKDSISKLNIDTNFSVPLRQVEILKSEMAMILEKSESFESSRTAYLYCNEKCGLAIFEKDSDYGIAYYPVPYATRPFFNLEWVEEDIVKFDYSVSPYTRVNFEIDIDQVLIIKSEVIHTQN